MWDDGTYGRTTWLKMKTGERTIVYVEVPKMPSPMTLMTSSRLASIEPCSIAAMKGSAGLEKDGRGCLHVRIVDIIYDRNPL